MSWNEMLGEFRALGGVADNAVLKEGRFGRGLFAIDPAKPVRLFAPASLLVELDHVDLDNGTFNIRAGAPLDERARRFWANYEREFGWETGGKSTDDLVRMIASAPAELRALLDKPLNADFWLIEPTQASLRKRFIAARSISYQGRWHMMPVVELCNHGHAGHFEIDGGIELRGTFPDEVLSEYAVCDAWQIFTKWGFASADEDFALSLDMRIETEWGSIRIARESGIDNKPGAVPFVPTVEADGNALKLSYMLLGHKKYPRLARGIFQRILRDARRGNADALFDRIQHVNRTAFYNLIAASEDAVPALGRLLRAVARQQLEAMSWSIGTREL